MMTTLGLVCAQAVLASNWVGEAYVAGSNVYIYDKTTDKFIGHVMSGSSYYPVEVSKDNADLFYTTTNNGNYYVFRNQVVTDLVGNQMFLNIEGAGSTKYAYAKANNTGSARGYDLISNGTNYAIHYRWVWNHWYLSPVSDKNIENLVGYAEKSSTYYQNWYFISEDQFIYRPLLDEMIATIEASKLVNASSEDPQIQALNEAYKNALMAVGTPSTIKSSYTTLEKTYTTAQNGADLSAALSDLRSAINRGEQMQNSLVAIIDIIPASFSSAMQDANDLIKEVQAYLTAANKEEYIERLNIETLRLSAVLDTYSSAYVNYWAALRRQAGNVRYTFSSNDVNAVLNAFETKAVQLVATLDNTNAIEEAITAAQNNFKNWVINDWTAKGYGFPIGADLSAFILNSSFETGTTYGWTVSSDATISTAGATDGSYSLSASSISQEITGLPAGTYRITANCSSFVPKEFTITEAMVKAGTNKVTIKASGSVIDNFKLTLISGPATTFRLDETVGVPAEALPGSYSRLAVKRVIKHNANGYWNTLCLPFSLSAEQTQQLFGQVMQVSGLSVDTKGALIHYEEANCIVAGEAYLVQAKEARIDSIILTNGGQLILEPTETVHKYSEAAQMTMCGNLVNFASGKIPYLTGIAENNTTYVLQNNEFRMVDQNTTVAMKAFRAYFHLYLNFEMDAAQIRLAFDEEELETSALSAIEEAAETEAQCFDLSGRRTSAAHGLVIQQGRKYIIR